MVLEPVGLQDTGTHWQLCWGWPISLPVEMSDARGQNGQIGNKSLRHKTLKFFGNYHVQMPCQIKISTYVASRGSFSEKEKLSALLTIYLVTLL